MTKEEDLFIRLWHAPQGTPLLHIGRGTPQAIAILHDDIRELAVGRLEFELHTFTVGEFPAHMVDKTVLSSQVDAPPEVAGS